MPRNSISTTFPQICSPPHIQFDFHHMPTKSISTTCLQFQFQPHAYKFALHHMPTNSIFTTCPHTRFPTHAHKYDSPHMLTKLNSHTFPQIRVPSHAHKFDFRDSSDRIFLKGKRPRPAVFVGIDPYNRRDRSLGF